MAVTFSNTNKPLNPRGNDASPLAYNRAALYSGKALSFDGVNDEVLSAITISGAKTFCAWINADGSNNERIISIFTGGYSNITFSSNKFNMYDGTNIPETTTTFQTDQWYFVVAVQEANNAKIYINGISQPLSTTNWIEHTYTGATISIGRDASSGAYYDGEISGVRVFNTALTAAQIADLYNNPEKIVPTGVDNTALKLWLPMMETTGTTAYDGSGNGNHGTISGATYVNGVGAPVAQTSVIDWNKGTNLFTHSQALSNWTQLNTITTDDSAISPDGSQNASKLVATSGTNNVIYQGVTAGTYTASMFAKKGEFEGLVMATGNTGAFFNLNTNTYRTDYGSPPTSYNIEDYGNGWHRYSITFTEGGANNLYIGPNDNVSNTLNVNGNNSDGIYIFGVQIKTGTAGPYTPTFGTTQPTPVLLPAGLTTGRDITGVNLFENVRKQGALNLDGNSYAEVHDNESLDVTALTCEGWMYAKDIVGTDNRIITKWDIGYPERSFQLYGQAATANFMLSDGAAAYPITGGTLFTQGNWYHVVGTYDGTTQRLYVDGVQVANTALSITVKQSDFKVMLGGYVTGVNSNNPIAQPRIYNRALTASEVLRNYNSGKNTYTNS